MAKSAQAFRTIREVADWLDVAAHVLRFWESKFNQIKPVKRAGGRRYYRPADMELVGGIKVLLHDRGLTIRGVQKMISEEGLEAVTALSPPIDSLIDDADIVEGGASGDWDVDVAAEVLETPLGQALLGADPSADPTPAAEPITETPPAALMETDTAAADALAQPSPEPEPGTETSEQTPTALPEAFSTQPPQGLVSPDGAPEARPDTLPDTAPGAVSPDPDPDAASHGSDPAEGPLGKLTVLAQLPASQRAALSPHIAALANLRDRMSAPVDTH